MNLTHYRQAYDALERMMQDYASRVAMLEVRLNLMEYKNEQQQKEIARLSELQDRTGG